MSARGAARSRCSGSARHAPSRAGGCQRTRRSPQPVVHVDTRVPHGAFDPQEHRARSLPRAIGAPCPPSLPSRSNRREVSLRDGRPHGADASPRLRRSPCPPPSPLCTLRPGPHRRRCPRTIASAPTPGRSRYRRRRSAVPAPCASPCSCPDPQGVLDLPIPTSTRVPEAVGPEVAFFRGRNQLFRYPVYRLGDGPRNRCEHVGILAERDRAPDDVLEARGLERVRDRFRNRSLAGLIEGVARGGSDQLSVRGRISGGTRPGAAVAEQLANGGARLAETGFAWTARLLHDAFTWIQWFEYDIRFAS